MVGPGNRPRLTQGRAYVTIYSYQWHFGVAFSSPAAKSTENQELCVLLQSRLTLRGVDLTADRLTECGTSQSPVGARNSVSP